MTDLEKRERVRKGVAKGRKNEREVGERGGTKGVGFLQILTFAFN